MATITTRPIVNLSGTTLANETGITVFVNNVSTGALVVMISSETSDADGIVVVSHASIIALTTYRVTTRLSNGQEAMRHYAAA